MSAKIKTTRFRIGGMTCINCQNRIEEKLRNTAGVSKVEVSYSRGMAHVSFDTGILSFEDITAIIEKLDYEVLAENDKRASSLVRVTGFLLVILVLFAVLQHFGFLNYLVPGQLADTTMGYGMMFVIGLITSVHCIAMCGGINLSQCLPRSTAPTEEKPSRMATFFPAFLYNFGRVVSYTIIGAVLGLVGMILGGGGSEFGLPAIAQGILKIIAGVFMISLGISMLNLFPFFRKIRLYLPKVFVRKVNEGKKRSKSPLIVGLLNGLMPCGPLQSMQLVALISGNPLTGALAMFLFSVGTVPLMLGLGSIVSALGKKFTAKVMSVGAVVVVVLGLAMLSQGVGLASFISSNLLLVCIIALCVIGIVSAVPIKKPSIKTASVVTVVCAAVLVVSTWNIWPVNSASGTNNPPSEVLDDKQYVNSTLSPNSFPNITVKVGIPVVWTIYADEKNINGCNDRINIYEYDIMDYGFQPGDNVIEFTPTQTGTFQYSCWMGMIFGNITVVE